jgi:lauroyl/myristoyl acyltransferase
VRNWLKFQSYRVALALVGCLSDKLADRFAVSLATAAFLLTPKRRAIVRANLRQVMGPQSSEPELNRLAARIYQTVARYYVDLLSTPRFDVQALRDNRVRQEGYEHLRDALNAGQGAIVATVHYGCPEMALQAARAWNLRFLVLIEAIEPPELAALFAKLRGSHQHRFEPAGLAGVKAAIRTLRGGGAVLLAVDRDIQGHGACVPFFGRPARIPLGAAELARLTGAPILPAISRRLPNGQAFVTIEAPLEMAKTADARADAEDTTARLIQRFEPYIRSDPGQWLVLQPLWVDCDTPSRTAVAGQPIQD